MSILAVLKDFLNLLISIQCFIMRTAVLQGAAYLVQADAVIEALFPNQLFPDLKGSGMVPNALDVA